SMTGWEAGVVLGIVLVVVVLAGSFFPWLALSTTKTDVPQLYSDEDINLDPDEIRADQVRVDAKVAHEILVAISLSVGVLVVLTSPFVVRLGLFGTLLALAACVVLMLRTRQYRTGSEVLVGLVSGIAGLLAIGAALLVYHESWRPTTAVVLAAAGGVLLVLTLVPDVGSIRRGRLADVAETTCLLAMLPLMVLASGLFGAAVAGF
ncbi:MAG TPA: type VII secretion integral membrane protein EccD, partial [Nocardioides sp.]